MKSIAVFCGSSDGASHVYIESAKIFGKELAKRDITLVYGGASVGVMGAVADAVLEEGGQVIGIMPSFLEQREISHKRLSRLIVVDSMHERKAKMAELADGSSPVRNGLGLVSRDNGGTALGKAGSARACRSNGSIFPRGHGLYFGRREATSSPENSNRTQRKRRQTRVCRLHSQATKAIAQ